MSVLSRYIELLATAQFFASEKGTYLSDKDAFYYAGKTTSLVPTLHGLIVVGVLDVLARALHAPSLDSMILRAIIIAPFLVVSVFLGSDYDYLINLRSRTRSDSPDAKARRQR
jgi:hypothetical protein